MARRDAKEILIITHRLTKYGDNSVCAAHTICSLLVQNKGKVICTTVIPEIDFDSSAEKDQLDGLVGANSRLEFLFPSSEKNKRTKENPHVTWLSKYHNTYYDSFSSGDERLDDVKYVVGFMPTTINTALDVASIVQEKANAYRKKNIPKPKVIMINCTKVPDEDYNDDLETWAEKADKIFSIGSSLFDHYNDIFSTFRNSKSILDKHQEFIFRPNSVYYDQEWKPPNLVKFSSFWNKGTHVDHHLLRESSANDYQSTCKALGEVSKDLRTRGERPPEWQLYGLRSSKDESPEVEQIDLGTMKSNLSETEGFTITPKLEITKETKLLPVFRSSRAILAPEQDDGFNFYAWEGMGFGTPAFVASNSGIDAVLKKLDVTIKFKAVVDVVGGFVSDSENWKQHIYRSLLNESAGVSNWTRELKDKILHSPYLKQSEENFVAYFGLGKNCTYVRGQAFILPSSPSTSGQQESHPHTKATDVAQDQDNLYKSQENAESSSLIRICVVLKNDEKFGKGGTISSPVTVIGSSGEITAHQHLADLLQIMIGNSEHPTVPVRIKQSWDSLRRALEEEGYRLISVETGCVFLMLFDSRNAGQRVITPKIKQALLNFAKEIGIEANGITVEHADLQGVGSGDGANANMTSSQSDDSLSQLFLSSVNLGGSDDLPSVSTRTGSMQAQSEEIVNSFLNTPLTEGELSKLARKLSPDKLKSIAQESLGIKDADISTLSTKHREDTNGFKREILIIWKNRSSSNNRKALATILYEAAEDDLLDCRIIETILKVKKSDIQPPLTPAFGGDKGMTGISIVTSSTMATSSNIQSGNQTVPRPDPTGELTSMDAQSLHARSLQGTGSTKMHPQASYDYESMQETVRPPPEGNTGAQAAGHSTTQGDQGRKKNIFTGPDNTMTKDIVNTSFPKGVIVDRFPHRHDETYKKYTWFDWQRFDKVTSRTTAYIDLLKDKLKPIVVAIIDTGIYEKHPHLSDKILKCRSMCFAAGDESYKDLRVDMLNHGTMVAGIVALNGPVNVKLINLKVQPVGNQFGDMRDLVKALQYIKDLDGTDAEVDIVNMSMGQHDLPEGLNEAINEMASNKILFASAGNYGAKGSNTITYPALHNNVICVGSCDYLGHMSPVSSQGREVDFLCPGQEILSTGNEKRFPFFRANGTSFASPHAAAVAAHALVALRSLAEPPENKSFKEKIEGAPIKITSTIFMKNFLIQMCAKSSQAGSSQGHGVLYPYDNGFRADYLLKDYCEIALTGRYNYISQ